MGRNRVRLNITVDKQILQDYRNLSKTFYKKFGIEPTLSGFISHELPRFTTMMEFMVQHVDKSWTREHILDYFLNLWAKNQKGVNKIA